MNRLGLAGSIIVRESAADIEEYLQAADIGLYTSESESFCLGILEAMCFECPSVAMGVGGIPEVIEDGVTGCLVEFGDTAAAARGLEALMHDTSRRHSMGQAAQSAARARFSAPTIIPQYEALYRRLIEAALSGKAQK